MPFWTYLNAQQSWKSESCYLVCTTGASSIYASKRANARWANNSTANAYPVINNPNQAVFPGGSARVTQQPPVNPLNVDTQSVATSEFLEEAGLTTVPIANGQFQLTTANGQVATAYKASYYHGNGFHAMILWFNSATDLDAIAAAINGRIAADNNRYASTNPPPVNGYSRADDELASATVANHLTTDWKQLFNTNAQDWFLELYNDAINM
jgi:8-oxo-dGTP pyrophosphatase MutT (NUDIX family)